jgi:predicted O-methyltransferase YrrM
MPPYDECLSLMETLMGYRHQPIYRQLRKFGKRQSMLHPDVLMLVYYLAHICPGAVLEVGAFRGGSTVAAAWGIRDSGTQKKLITIEVGGILRKHKLATRDIVGSLRRNLARQRVAELVTVITGYSFRPDVVQAVSDALGAEQIGLFILDADADCKRDINRYASKLIENCWLVIDDYGGSVDNPKVSPTKIQVDALAAAGRLVPLGYYGLGTWVGKWRTLTPPPAQHH